MTDTVIVFEDEKLLKRAVLRLAKTKGNRPRWAYVKEFFALGNTASRRLCQRFGIDPWVEAPTEPKDQP